MKYIDSCTRLRASAASLAFEYYSYALPFFFSYPISLWLCSLALSSLKGTSPLCAALQTLHHRYVWPKIFVHQILTALIGICYVFVCQSHKSFSSYHSDNTKATRQYYSNLVVMITPVTCTTDWNIAPCRSIKDQYFVTHYILAFAGWQRQPIYPNALVYTVR